MRLIAYYRVSTKQQGESGLGLEGQQASVEAYARANGATIIGTYTEVESGKNNSRPQLQKAMAHARRSKATLCVEKLDRLSRNVAFLSALMESGVDFVAVDNPTANRLTLHILSAVAEAEAKAISERTKTALKAYKARGGQLGGSLPQCRTLTDESRQKAIAKSNATNRQLADGAYADLVEQLAEWRLTMTLQQIADRLNDEGHTTRRGRPWNQVQVMRVLNRFQKSAAV